LWGKNVFFRINLCAAVFIRLALLLAESFLIGRGKFPMIIMNYALNIARDREDGDERLAEKLICFNFAQML